jgi:hypothetical protein
MTKQQDDLIVQLRKNPFFWIGWTSAWIIALVVDVIAWLVK